MFLSLFALQAACPKAYKSIATNSFEIIVCLSMWRVIFRKVFQKWMAHELFIFNDCQNLVHDVWDFPNIKVWLSLPSFSLIPLDIEKIEIQKQTMNSSCFHMGQSDNLKNHQTWKQSL
jgi:hypothetical protein